MMKSAETPQTKQFDKSSPFCWNQQCPDYGRVGGVNIIKFGFTRKGRQRYRCTTCHRVVAETRGTVFHGKHHSQETIVECLAMLADRNSLAAIHRVKGVKEETVTQWLKQIEPQMEQIEAVLLKDHKLSRAQLDALWTYVGHKGEKKVSRKKTLAARSGAGRPSKPRRDYGLGARSPKPKKKSPNI
jgi:transposase-like protein